MTQEERASRYQVSAPGKLIICGEYAVLDGAPSLVLALDRRLQLKLEPQTQSDSSADAPLGLKLRCPGFSHKSYFITDEGSLGPELALFSSMFWFLLKQHFAEPLIFIRQAWSLVSDSSAFFDAEAKLGLGSSAALCVALDELFKALPESRLGSESLTQRWTRLQKVHSLAQGKVGSGVDLAASLHGAALVFNNGQSVQRDLSFTACSLPEGLYLDFIWTGQSASTPAMLGSLSKWRAKHTQLCASFIDRLSDASASVCKQTDSRAFLDRLRAFCAILNDFDRAADLGIFAAGHAALYQHSLQFDAALYKPCGAGGGDLGLLLSHSGSQRQDMLQFIKESGLRCLDLHIDSRSSGRE
ncbi:mevalonate kinase [Agaribacterium sp. ZY112]|uniref:mevalonate kinase family protein n=1 Tax=Agaribacterium sp. ZY112 TaxID=3233574 RepID=UPI0035242086